MHPWSHRETSKEERSGGRGRRRYKCAVFPQEGKTKGTGGTSSKKKKEREGSGLLGEATENRSPSAGAPGLSERETWREPLRRAEIQNGMLG